MWEADEKDLFADRTFACSSRLRVTVARLSTT